MPVGVRCIQLLAESGKRLQRQRPVWSPKMPIRLAVGTKTT